MTWPVQALARDEVESVVLLDEAGRAIGVTPKSTVHHGDTPLHLAFSCHLFDAAGNVLVTRRALDKVTWPGVWTNGCCGHPAPGEPLTDAVRRRIRDELGVEVSDLRLLLPAFRYRAERDGVVENEMCPVFAAFVDGPLDPDPAEVAAADWQPWETFREEVLAGTRQVSPWCQEQVEQLPEEPAHAPEASPDDLPPAAVR